MRNENAETLDHAAGLLDEFKCTATAKDVRAIAARLREPSVPLDVVEELRSFVEWLASFPCDKMSRKSNTQPCGKCEPCRATAALAAYDRWKGGPSDE